MKQVINEINKYAKPMDIILLGSDDIIGRLIRHAQKIQTPDNKPSLWSHCAMWVDEETIIESTIDFEPHENGKRMDNGVQYNPIERLDKYSKIALIQYNLSEISRELLFRRADRLYKQKTTYPVLGLIGSLLSYWIFKWQSNPLQTKHSLYCSAFVQDVYQSIGIDFDPKHTARNTSPEMIYQHQMEGRIVRWIR